MIKPEVLTHIGGAQVVVRLNKSGQHYIEARKWYTRESCGLNDIEVVNNGHVYLRVRAMPDVAPDIIIKMLRSYAQHGRVIYKETA